jgi:hypothetical protein
MIRITPLFIACMVGLTSVTRFLSAQDDLGPIPKLLQPWEGWVLWDKKEYGCPTPFNTHEQPICHWPSKLKIETNKQGADWKAEIRVFAESWVRIPGDDGMWPVNVLVNDQPAPVLKQNGGPAVPLLPGSYAVSGKFQWQETPEKIAIPTNFGIIDLSVEGAPIEQPNWDQHGYVWLKRVQATEDAKDQVTVQAYRVLEDGLPMWLRTQLDVSVSGKSREEEIGFVLPEGWQLSFVASPIPVALDEQGRMKVQVRAGTWQIRIDAFRNSDLSEIRYAEGVTPAFDSELIAIRAKPVLRTAELQGAMPVDAQMTTFPQAWRDLPLYEWKTTQSLKWIEKTRGMGLQHPDRLTIRRQLWLDDDGSAFTYRDKLEGQPKEISRLDVAANHELGVVRIDGTRQLITENPKTGSQGIELRSTKPKIEAIGRTNRFKDMPATGWKTDVDQLDLALVLPPGWRVFALFGADRVEGDWLTAWSLLDLFLLLIFAVAVYRLMGLWAGAIAFLAFGLSFHEPGSPRLTWLFLLVPLAILHVVKEGRAVPWLQVWRYVATCFLLLNFVPFAAMQLQNALYPQLEPVGVPYSNRTMFEWLNGTYNVGASVAEYAREDDRFNDRSMDYELSSKTNQNRRFESKITPSQNANMQNDASVNVQTGVAKPEWQGNQVTCYWDGPVSAEQTIRPLLISCNAHRCFTVARLILLSLLLFLFLRGRFSFPSWPRKTGSVAVVLLGFMIFSSVAQEASCQVPDKETLQLLRDRLLEPSDAFPNAAQIPSMKFQIENSKLHIEAEVHAALDVAVPVPGRIPTWSPLTVTIDNNPATVCRRDDGHLWVLVSKGVHQLVIDGLLDEATEWVCPFGLVPRYLQLVAPEWNVTGLSASGQPENQLFFVRKEQRTEGAATYDQKNFRSIVAVERQIEVGLLWKVHNVVKRLSPTGKAISIRVPLLAGERVLTSSIINEQGSIEVNLGAEESELRWESELTPLSELVLEAPTGTQSTEKWSLMSSPVWNVDHTGLQPIYEANQAELIPVWHPWPGEKVTLTFRRPSAVPGKTLTVQRAKHHVSLGSRQRTSQLELQVESSLGGEFPLVLPESAVVTNITLDARPLPIRRDKDTYLISLQPGAQSLNIEWKIDEVIKTTEVFPAVRLPVDSANITTTIHVPESRWILWADGPLRGPAVRFWVMLIISLAVAMALSCHPKSPLSRIEWLLLGLGLTQVHAFAGLIVVGWLFFIAWRATRKPSESNRFAFNFLQLALIGTTVMALGILIVIVGQGLLGSPEMFIVGNNSYRNFLNWFEPNAGADLPAPTIVTVSVWYYRLLMLAWALWLANALLRWLSIGWKAFTNGGVWSRSERPKATNKSPMNS